jgi:two-component system chemotaxis response regulator CheB
VIVQHICQEFSPQFASRVAHVSGLAAGPEPEAILEENHVYLATGDYHLKLVKENGVLRLQRSDVQKNLGHRPSVDTLFESAARCSGFKVAVLLTGMGSDGALGMKALFDSKSSLNIGQNEASCVVYGMPKVAREKGAVHHEASVEEIRRILIGCNANKQASAA